MPLALRDRLMLWPARQARWLAPSRTLRQVHGWRPLRVDVSAAKAILVIRPDDIGDLVLTGPFLRALRASAPDAHISLLVKTALRDLVALCPHVDAVHGLGFGAATGAVSRLRLLVEARRLRGLLPSGGADLVLLPRSDVDWYDSALIGHLLAGDGAIVRNRDASGRPASAGPPDPAVAVEDFDNPVMEHEVLRSLRFLAWCGGPETSDSRLEAWIGEADRAFARTWLARHFARPAPLLVMHPSGGRSRLKQWPIDRFKATLRDLKATTSFNILIIGGAGEGWMAEAFVDEVCERCALGIGAFGLRQLWAVLEQSALFVGGDSGPMHMAAAAGTRVIGVFGPTSELRFRPWGPDCSVVSLRYPCTPDLDGSFEDRCKGCHFQEPLCLTQLPAERVVAEIHAACAWALAQGNPG